MNLELWRSSLPDFMKWSDMDPPSSDINTACMRAKYYSVWYIIHRPLLYHALHNTQGAAVDTPTASNVVSGMKSQQASPSMPHNGLQDMHQLRDLEQFGNMLVLSATYMLSLSEFVDQGALCRLLIRTINFLLRSKNLSPSLRKDADILTEIYFKIFGESPNSSFVSNEM
ncbi:hypothetical protein VTN00DRAFT_9638 [Thermoascus crustaceus]|uniref:uncharacterized protein n=1 Tax=Thermoascus crustaceus TaxID=5088 RepID=UPI0037433BF4